MSILLNSKIKSNTLISSTTECESLTPVIDNKINTNTLLTPGVLDSIDHEHKSILLVEGDSHICDQTKPEPEFIQQNTSWGDIEGFIGNQKDLINLINSKKETECNLHSVNTINDLYNLPTDILKEGALAYIKTLDLYFQYTQQSWKKASFNSKGIPIYTQALLEELTTPPEDYILVRDPNINTNPKELSYLDTLFSAIRKLQAEVARLKNSFKYGINSYTGTKTAMSSVIENTNSEEPLWALEEDDLSELLECTINMDSTHQLKGDVLVDNENGLLTISEAYFKDPETGFKKQSDPKSIIFITSTGLDIEFNLHGNKELKLNLKDLLISNVDLFNILIVLSKKTKKTINDNLLYGSNFIWIQITDAKTNKVLKSGYYNELTLQSKLYELKTLYYIDKVIFKNLILSKFNSYVKAQDFSYEVIPSIPNEDDYKLGVAHLTIRSVSSKSILDYVKDLLLSNELIWVEDTRSLCIKSNGKIYNIGGTNNDDNTMTITELIASLESLGIIVSTVENGEYNLKLSDLTGVTFIHEDTGKKFNITVDSEGNLKSTEESINLLVDRLKNVTLPNNPSRGFISNLRLAEATTINANGDVGLLSDRVKIGAIYAPQVGRILYGCSHAYVELENTSDQDLTLDGCYLHAAVLDTDNNTKIYSLPLKGVLPAGGTFLIRGKQYTNFDDINTILKIKSYDLEWYYNKELVDFLLKALCFLLIYNVPTVDTETTFIGLDNNKLKINNPYFIDSACVRSKDHCKWNLAKFVITDNNTTRDYVLKNTFELDPAKQAFLALHASDSSRVRGANKNDFKPFYIDKPVIEFPNSDPVYDVSLITPKASFEKKNISTDKTKLNLNKPNMVYCSFGINMHTTRCFNWISVGSYDEFIWIRKRGNDTWKKFESYKQISDLIAQEPGDVVRKEFSVNINNIVYARMQGRFPGDNSFYTAHKCIIELPLVTEKTVYEYRVGRADISGNMGDYISEIQAFTLFPSSTVPRVYHITDQQGFYWMEYQTWAGAANALYDKIKSDMESETFIPVIINTGDVTQNGTRINEWLDYYLAGHKLFAEFEHMSVVGNNDLCGTDPSILGTGDDVGKSNGYYHHLFNCYEIDTEDLIINNKYIPSTYYFECDTGTRFININSEITFINCRDWFNLKINDGIAYNIYTGWSTGNNSPVDTPTYTTTFTPIYNTLFKWLSDKECIVSCHEIPFTVMTKENMSVNNSLPGYMTASRSVDGKSGNLVGSHLNLLTASDNTALYWFSRLLEFKGVRIVLGGHKHTYTCTYPVREFYFYNDGNKNSLIDGPAPMNEDLSDEYKDGKHKITWGYTRTDSDPLLKFSEGDFGENNTCFIPANKPFNTSRLPLVKFSGIIKKASHTDGAYAVAPYEKDFIDSEYLPIIGYSTMTNGVIYFMCLATGYKQTSNKELPGSAQAFSLLLPLTQFNNNKDVASSDLQAPMFGILKWIKGLDEDYRVLLLVRVKNIQENLAKPLYNNVGEFSILTPTLEYINCIPDLSVTDEKEIYIIQRFGRWAETESNILSYEVQRTT